MPTAFQRSDDLRRTGNRNVTLRAGPAKKYRNLHTYPLLTFRRSGQACSGANHDPTKRVSALELAHVGY